MVVALIKEQAERVRPPRALWVPFPLGRPFGAPDNAEQQRRVLRRALALLEAPSGPVLVDFDEADAVEEEDAAWACPVSFASPNADSDDIGRRVADEVTMLRPWHELGVERRGRTTLGLAKAPIEEAAAWLAAFAEGSTLPAPAPEESMADNLRWSAEDLKNLLLRGGDRAARPGLRKPARVVVLGGEQGRRVAESAARSLPRRWRRRGTRGGRVHAGAGGLFGVSIHFSARNPSAALPISDYDRLKIKQLSAAAVSSALSRPVKISGQRHWPSRSAGNGRGVRSA